MSKPRYDWWGYVKKMLYRYPNCQRTAENNAIMKAIASTGTLPNAEYRLELIRLMYWAKNKYNLAGAALLLPGVSEATAKRWHREFVLEVARNLGLLRPAKK
jgi:hypothetical protein